MRSEGRAAQAPIFLLVTKAREGAQEGGYAVTWASSPRLPAGLPEAEKGQTPEVSSKEPALGRWCFAGQKSFGQHVLGWD